MQQPREPVPHTPARPLGSRRTDASFLRREPARATAHARCAAPPPESQRAVAAPGFSWSRPGRGRRGPPASRGEPAGGMESGSGAAAQPPGPPRPGGPRLSHARTCEDGGGNQAVCRRGLGGPLGPPWRGRSQPCRCRCWNEVRRRGGLTDHESAAVRGPWAPSRAR